MHRIFTEYSQHIRSIFTVNEHNMSTVYSQYNYSIITVYTYTIYAQGVYIYSIRTVYAQ